MSPQVQCMVWAERWLGRWPRARTSAGLSGAGTPRLVLCPWERVFCSASVSWDPSLPLVWAPAARLCGTCPPVSLPAAFRPHLAGVPSLCLCPCHWPHCFRHHMGLALDELRGKQGHPTLPILHPWELGGVPLPLHGPPGGYWALGQPPSSADYSPGPDPL